MGGSKNTRVSTRVKVRMTHMIADLKIILTSMGPEFSIHSERLKRLSLKQGRPMIEFLLEYTSVRRHDPGRLVTKSIRPTQIKTSSWETETTFHQQFYRWFAMFVNLLRRSKNNLLFRRQPEAPLPDNWDMNTTEEGVRYFIDHENKITTFQDPRTQPNVNGKLAGVKSFRWKYGQFRYLCQSNAMTQVF